MAVTTGAGVAFVLPEERRFGRVLSINTYFEDAPATGAVPEFVRSDSRYVQPNAI